MSDQPAKSEQHSSPRGDCVFCCEELTKDNWVEYRATPNGPWMCSVYCQLCIESQFIEKQWETYLSNIAKADCAAALRRVITNPPPINVKDAGLPCEDAADEGTAAAAGGAERGKGEVESFWFCSDGQPHSAKLKGSLTGEERERFWREKKEFLTATEEEEERQKRDAATAAASGARGVEAAAAAISAAAQHARSDAIR